MVEVAGSPPDNQSHRGSLKCPRRLFVYISRLSGVLGQRGMPPRPLLRKNPVRRGVHAHLNASPHGVWRHHETNCGICIFRPRAGSTRTRRHYLSPDLTATTAQIALGFRYVSPRGRGARRGVPSCNRHSLSVSFLRSATACDEGGLRGQWRLAGGCVLCVR